MKMSELRKKTAKDLQKLLGKNTEQLAKTAQQLRVGEEKNVSAQRNLRKTNARIKTLLNEQSGEEK